MDLLKNLNEEYLSNNDIKKIIDRDYPNLFLLKYDKNDKKEIYFKNESVKQARGIILEKDTNNIICYSLDKFEDKDDLIKQDEISIDGWQFEDSIDGTQIRLYYYDSKWISTTARRIDAKKSKWNYVKTFYELFNDVEQLINYELLNKDYTYTFILKHIENRIVSNVTKNELIHIHTRNNKTLEEINIDINIPKPIKYEFDSYEDFKKELENLDFENKGYVVKHNNKRYMFLSKEYQKIKQLKGNHLNISYNYLELLRDNKLDEFLEYFPEFQIKFDNVIQKINDLGSKLHDLYIKKNVKKEITLNDVEKEYRKILYQLHGIYLNEKTIITQEVVINYIFESPIGYIVKLLKGK
jgi:hypothetical protein